MENTKISYKEAVSYLYGLQKFGIKFGLSKTSNLLEAVGNPHNGQQYIHIGGTNGKGSVASFIASILIKAGLKVGFYSSPHLIRFTERFKINDKEISQNKAAALVEYLMDIFDPEEPPTYFEATTAMALIYFAEEETDIAIMEVGMGGRLDATNVITPLISVITNISKEHKEFLGTRLLDIAGEKAGIIKKRVDLVTGATQTNIINLFQSIAKEKGAPFWRVGTNMRYRITGSGLHYNGINRRLKTLQLGLRGKHQGRNAAIALAVIELLENKGYEISSRAIRQGLKDTSWPGRMHVIAYNPTIILDGAHNPVAVKVLVDSLKHEFIYKRLILVVGIMEDKDIKELLREIVPMAQYIIYTRPEYFRAAEPEVLMSEAAIWKRPGEVVPVLTNALDRAMEISDDHDLIVVCGSLFTVGEAMTYLDPDSCQPDGF